MGRDVHDGSDEGVREGAASVLAEGGFRADDSLFIPASHLSPDEGAGIFFPAFLSFFVGRAELS